MIRSCNVLAVLLVLGVLGTAPSAMSATESQATIPMNEWTFFDAADDLDAAWVRGNENREGLFIIDSAESIGGMSAPDGHYRLYGEAGRDFVMVNAFFSVKPGDWTLEFRAKMASLGTFLPNTDIDGGNLTAYRGFTIGVRFDGTRTFVIGFNNGILGVLGSAERYRRLDASILGGNDEDFHVWRIEYTHADAGVTIFKDGEEVARFSRVEGAPSGAQGGLRMFSAPINVYGTIDVLIDYVAFRSEG